MSDHEKPALTEGEIETMAWDLETKMMKIRKDPQAALAEGLAKIRAQQLAEMRALWAKVEAEILAKRDAVLAQLEERRVKREEEWAGLMSSASAELRAAFAEFIRLRQLDAGEPAEPKRS
jgi:hypothetical protein